MTSGCIGQVYLCFSLLLLLVIARRADRWWVLTVRVLRDQCVSCQQCNVRSRL